jgi:hypothetical protein
MVEALGSFSNLKKYFSKISPRKPDGSVWCSVILAQAIPFSVLMDKAKHSLENQLLTSGLRHQTTNRPQKLLDDVLYKTTR